MGTNKETSQQRHISVCVMLGAFMVGSVMTWEQNRFGLTSGPVSYSVSVGAIAGSLKAGLFVDVFGRKLMFIMLSTFFLCSWSLIVLVQSHTVLILARFLSGVGIGLTSVLIPIYVNEVAEKPSRKAFGALYFTFVNVGALLTYIFQTFSLCYDCVETVFIGLSLVYLMMIIIFLPESPDFIDRKVVSTSLESNTYGEKSLTVLMRLTRVVMSRKDRTLLFTLILFIVQTTCGLTTMKFVSGNGLVFIGSIEMYKMFFTLLLFIESLTSWLYYYSIAHKKIRKECAPVSLILISGCLLTMGLYFNERWYYDIGHWPALLAITLFLIVYNFGFGALPWEMLSDMPSMNFKGEKSLCYSAILITYWSFRLIENEILREYLYLAGIQVFCWSSVGVCTLATLFLYNIFPRTSGKRQQL